MYLIGQEEINAAKRVIESGQLFRYRGGEQGETDQFEKEWAEKIGCQHAIAMTSGTAALICGLVGMNIGPGDEVIIPAYTFMSTALAPLAVGAIPILANIDESLTIDPIDVQQRITPRTKAIIPVHMSGLPCNIDAITSIARENNLMVLEDACQAAGGSYKGRRLGSIGDAGAFSFNQFKIISCGEGGVLVTNNREIYNRALIHHDGGCVFREHAGTMDVPFFAGWNFRIPEILSAILRVQLQRLDKILLALREEKREIYQAFQNDSSCAIPPSHDPDGDCATTVVLQFKTPEGARSLISQLKEKQRLASCPIDSDRHVFTNWEPVLKKQGAHHPKRDAYKITEITPDYDIERYAPTLAILKRSVYLDASITRTKEDLNQLIDQLKGSLPCNRI